jgi:DHA1 family tetracycline resistance protein-like MFS transporter
MKENRQAALGFIFFTMLLDVIGFGIIIPVLAKLIGEMTHASNSDVSVYGGFLLFTFAIMQFLFSPLIGNLSDKYGRRPVLLVSLFGMSLDYMVLAFAPTIGWLFVGRILAGIAGASFTTASAYIADISTPEKRAQNFGMIGVAFGIGFILGPLIGGFLGQYGTRWPFYAAAGLAMINMIYGFFVLPESLTKENRRQFEWKKANPIGSIGNLNKYPKITGLLAAIFCLYVAGHATQSTWVYYTTELFKWSPKMIGISLGLVGLLVGIVQGGLVRVINPKIGNKMAIYIGLAIYCFGNLLFAFANKEWMMFAFLIPYCLGGIANPSLQAIISNGVPDNEQGALQGLLTSLQSLSSIAGPLVMTNLFAFFIGKYAPFYFPGAPFFLGALLVMAGLFFAFRSLGKTEPTETEREAVRQELVEAE